MNARDGNVLSQEQVEAALEKQVAPKITPARLDEVIAKEEYHVFPGTNLTVCVLTLSNGFTVTGESACASPENFNAEIGRSIARRNAKDKIWSLEGYVLRNKLALIEEAGQPTGGILSLGSRVATYVGTKVVHAVPMTRQAYNDLRGWELPADENGADEGYLVQYADGGAKNVDGFDGYVSWSPQDVFEKAYTLGVPLKTTNFLTRLTDEYKQTADRYEKLKAFMGTDGFKALAKVDQEDLEVQLPAMQAYVGILFQRLKRLTGEKTE